MAWPVVMFIGDDIMAHFGISPPPYGGNEITATPNCVKPNHKDGFHAHIQSVDPQIPIHVIHENPHDDIKTLAKGVRETVKILDVLKDENVIGSRIQPSSDDLSTDYNLEKWIRSHVGMLNIFHWFQLLTII